jgi:hypothetical protein
VDLGTLLVDAVKATPVVAAYYSQVAAHMIALAQNNYPKAGYAAALRAAFADHGILSLQHTTVTLSDAGRALGLVADRPNDLETMALSGSPYGLDSDLLVHVGSGPKRFAVASAAPDLGAVSGTSHDRAAAAYLEDLFRRGHVHIAEEARTGREIDRDRRVHTHEVVNEKGALVLRRRVFDCGFSPAG